MKQYLEKGNISRSKLGHVTSKIAGVGILWCHGLHIITLLTEVVPVMHDTAAVIWSVKCSTLCPLAFLVL